MRARPLPVVLAALATLLIAGIPASSAQAALGGAPCSDSGFRCGGLQIPLDRSGAVAGSVTLQAAVLPAGTTQTQDAIVGLAGGPGQAALPLKESFASDLAPYHATHDLIVFDQRGTGSSEPLSCPAFGTANITGGDVRSCAEQLGPRRGLYRSIDSADDVESLRVAGGYRKLILYGVSYGTKVALTYAARYPANVEALILDSVVPVDGPEPFGEASFAAVPRMLADLCAASACRKASKAPMSDLRSLVRKLRRGSIASTITAPNGNRLRVRLSVLGLWEILLAGDLNPTLRAELPSSVRAALRGDTTPVLRLSARAAGLSGTAGQALGGEGLDALFAATRCEESSFPWTRSAGLATRGRQVDAKARSLPSSAFAPFGVLVSVQASVMPLCANWPNASPAPAATPPLPAVPTLVLDGAGDLRTPAEQARRAVAAIPGAVVDVVPKSGHSVLGSDLGGCAAKQLADFAAGTSTACTPQPNPINPTPVPPRRLSQLPGSNLSQRTLRAVDATIRDITRQLIGDAIAADRSVIPGSRTGGLRGGVATVGSGLITLHRVSYVPGVRVSGTYALDGSATTTLAITGSAAAKGQLTVNPDGSITGVLDGRKIAVAASSRARAARRVRSLPRGLRIPPFLPAS